MFSLAIYRTPDNAMEFVSENFTCGITNACIFYTPFILLIYKAVFPHAKALLA